MPNMTQKQLLDELTQQYEDGKTETKDYIVNLMAYRAAMMLMQANSAFEAAEKEDEPPKYDKEQLAKYVQMMKDAGIEEEAHWLYGDSQFVPEPIALKFLSSFPPDSVVFVGHFHDRLTKTADGRTLEVLPAYADASELVFYDPSTPELTIFPADRIGDLCGEQVNQEAAES